MLYMLLTKYVTFPSYAFLCIPLHMRQNACTLLCITSNVVIMCTQCVHHCIHSRGTVHCAILFCRSRTLYQSSSVDISICTLRVILCLQSKAAELETVRGDLEQTKAQFHSLENSKGWLERRLNETEDNLNTTREEFETNFESSKREHEDSICRLNEEHLEEVQVWCHRETFWGLHLSHMSDHIWIVVSVDRGGLLESFD